MNNHMNKIIFSFLFLIVTCATSLSSAAELTGMALVAKLSQSLRGHQLSPEEIKEFSSYDLNDQEVLKQISDRFLKTETHANKLLFHLEELFSINTDFNLRSMNNQNQFRKNSLSDLFYRMSTENLSWDELLTGKTYTIFPNNGYAFPFTALSFGIISDVGFYGAVYNFPMKSYDGYVEQYYGPSLLKEPPLRISFDENDDRIAGALTTSRFFERYVTTGSNKNRRRAAAVFKIFLCDSMSAQVSPPDNRTKSILDLLYPGTFTEEEIRKVQQSGDSVHGSQADCMSCHYKLDPMGKTFLPSPLIVGPEPVAGKLQYKNTQNEILSIPVNGIGGLGKAITEQDEYLTCQTSHLWKWFIGTDVPLTKDTHVEIINAFNSVGRKTNDFISYLVSRPEFRQRQEQNPDIALASFVKSYLRRCDSCHSEVSTDNPDTEGKIPSFTAWPNLGKDVNFGDTPYWLKKVASALDLNSANIGHSRRMPPPLEKGGFVPSRRDLQKIKQWFDKGAPDENGKKMMP